MASEMVERVAKAIFECSIANETECKELARAAILAMRDPTPEMIERTLGDRTATSEAVIRKWQAMIDEALK